MSLTVIVNPHGLSPTKAFVNLLYSPSHPVFLTNISILDVDILPFWSVSHPSVTKSFPATCPLGYLSDLIFSNAFFQTPPSSSVKIENELTLAFVATSAPLEACAAETTPVIPTTIVNDIATAVAFFKILFLTLSPPD